MTILALLFVLNPPAVATIWLSYPKAIGLREGQRLLLMIAGAAALLLLLASLFGEPLLDAFSVSDSTYLIAAGTVVIFGALQGFLGFGLRPNADTLGWLGVATLTWLAGPPVLFTVVALTLDYGSLVSIVAIVLSVALVIGIAGVWFFRVRERYGMLLGLARRIFAAGAALAGVDLIRQGVLAI